MRIDVLDHGYVELVKNSNWGSDEDIIRAARMSTDKGFQGWGPKRVGGWYLNDNGELEDRGPAREEPGDEKLLKYLWEHKHHTPFEMAGFAVEVQAPIMVFREWHRHRTQSYNEMSGRYIELPDLMYVPDYERLKKGGQAKDNKQASGEELGDLMTQGNQVILEHHNEISRKTYEELIRRGLAKELARLVLPVAQYSRMRAAANLRNWLGFLALRDAPNAQWEIQQYAKAVATIVQELHPRTYALYQAERG